MFKTDEVNKLIIQDQGVSLTLLIGGVQLFVRLDEQEAIVPADGD